MFQLVVIRAKVFCITSFLVIRKLSCYNLLTRAASWLNSWCVFLYFRFWPWFSCMSMCWTGNGLHRCRGAKDLCWFLAYPLEHLSKSTADVCVRKQHLWFSISLMHFFEVWVLSGVCPVFWESSTLRTVPSKWKLCAYCLQYTCNITRASHWEQKWSPASFQRASRPAYSNKGGGVQSS